MYTRKAQTSSIKLTKVHKNVKVYLVISRHNFIVRYMENSETPWSPETNDTSELLHEERKTVLTLAEKLHAAAHNARGETASNTFHLYIVMNDRDIPFPAEKIRIVPRNTRIAEVTEAHLYFPIDADFREAYEDHTIPNTFFFNLRYRNGTMRRGIFLEQGVWAFEEGDNMIVDTGLLPVSSREKLDITTIFSSGSDLAGQDEYQLLQDLKLILGQRDRYRLGDLREPGED